MRNNTTSRLLALLSSLVVLAILLNGPYDNPVSAAGFTVSKFEDTNDGLCDADCSLREAIIAANAAPGSTITLGAGIYVLTLAGSDNSAALGDLDITAPLTIVGIGPDQTIIDAGSINERVFDIHPGANVSISGVSIINGTTSGTHGGGVACTQATLALEEVIIRHNAARFGLDGGGLYANECTVTLSATQVLNNAARVGAGIHAYNSTLLLANSTVAHNSAAEGGGGIMGLSSVTRLTYSTLLGNTAGSGGGGFFVGPDATLSIANSLVANNIGELGAGGLKIADDTAWATIENSTISGNRTNFYGGGISTRVPTTITHSTITDNWAGTDGISSGGGGLFAYQSGAQVRLRHTILAGNVDRNNSTNPDCQRWGGAAVMSQGYNLVEAVGNCSFGATGDITGQDALLAPLGDNGGPTWTHALLEGSPARDAGDPTFVPPPQYDQRGPGFGRVAGRIDIGAFEVWKRMFLGLIQRH